MPNKPNEKKQIDRTGLTYNTDPEKDADEAANVTRLDRKSERGVKIVKRG